MKSDRAEVPIANEIITDTRLPLPPTILDHRVDLADGMVASVRESPLAHPGDWLIIELHIHILVIRYFIVLFTSMQTIFPVAFSFCEPNKSGYRISTWKIVAFVSIRRISRGTSEGIYFFVMKVLTPSGGLKKLKTYRGMGIICYGLVRGSRQTHIGTRIFLLSSSTEDPYEAQMHSQRLSGCIVPEIAPHWYAGDWS